MGKANTKLFICMYHYTRELKNSRYPKIKGLDIADFRAQIDFFSSHFSVVRMEDVVAAKEGDCCLPPNALLLTFDDGYSDNFNFAFPILEEYGVQGSFFIPGKTFSEHVLLDVNKIHYILATADIDCLLKDVLERMDYYRLGSDYPSNEELFSDYAVANRFDKKETIFVKRVLQTVLPEKIRSQISSELFEKYVGISERQLAFELYMSPDQIRTMKRHGMHIGIHGYDHYWLGNLDHESMMNDINNALEVMDGFIDQEKWVMNFPYGNYNENVLEYVKSKGACLGLTTEVRVADLKQDSSLTLPRLDCNDFPPKSYNYKQIV